jgi:membrane protease YdiL (CAAX protease family)
MPKKETAVKHATLLLAYLLVVWGFYRFLFKLPEEIEELVTKPILWLVPVIYLVRKEKGNLASIGITFENLFPAIYFALGLGVVFAIEGALINFIRYGGANFSANIGENLFITALGLSLVTAITEEITFRGYLFARIWRVMGSEWRANFLTSFFWALVHIPVAIFWWDLPLPSTLTFLMLTAFFGVGSAFVFARTKNIFSSILLHVLWSWPIILFR